MSDKGEQVWLGFGFTWNTETPEGVVQHREVVRLELFMAWEIATVAQKLSAGQALAFAEFAVIVARMDPSATSVVPNAIEMAKINAAVRSLGRLFSRQWENLDDQVIDFTYHLMLAKQMSRDLAAQFASAKLGKTSTDAYRKKVDRWVKLHGFPPLGQTKRRPRK